MEKNPGVSALKIPDALVDLNLEKGESVAHQALLFGVDVAEEEIAAALKTRTTQNPHVLLALEYFAHNPLEKRTLYEVWQETGLVRSEKTEGEGHDRYSGRDKKGFFSKVLDAWKEELAIIPGRARRDVLKVQKKMVDEDLSYYTGISRETINNTYRRYRGTNVSPLAETFDMFWRYGTSEENYFPGKAVLEEWGRKLHKDLTTEKIMRHELAPILSAVQANFKESCGNRAKLSNVTLGMIAGITREGVSAIANSSSKERHAACARSSIYALARAVERLERETEKMPDKRQVLGLSLEKPGRRIEQVTHRETIKREKTAGSAHDHSPL
jgi:hypothetical protein